VRCRLPKLIGVIRVNALAEHFKYLPGAAVRCTKPRGVPFYQLVSTIVLRGEPHSAVLPRLQESTFEARRGKNYLFYLAGPSRVQKFCALLICIRSTCASTAAQNCKDTKKQESSHHEDRDGPRTGLFDEDESMTSGRFHLDFIRKPILKRANGLLEAQEPPPVAGPPACHGEGRKRHVSNGFVEDDSSFRAPPLALAGPAAAGRLLQEDPVGDKHVTVEWVGDDEEDTGFWYSKNACPLLPGSWAG